VPLADAGQRHDRGNDDEGESKGAQRTHEERLRVPNGGREEKCGQGPLHRERGPGTR
jgi:hypothetical protein